MSEHIMPVYNRLPLSFVKGDGLWLFDQDGNRYMDIFSGIGVNNLGHQHPAITSIIKKQAEQLLHTSNLFTIPEQETLADQLCQISGLDKVFFCNSGAESVEAAVKLARLYGHQKNIELPNIIVFDGSFHGRTLTTLSASSNRKIQQGFEPLTRGFIRSPYNDIDAVETIMKNNHNIVAIMLEPIQGNGGIIIPDVGFLTQLRELCDEKDCLLILDEVQTGIGRTGKWFAFQHENIKPDILCSAKALANGIPIGACIANEKASLFEYGKHGSTFGGNPFACTVAHAVLDTIEKENLLENAKTQGEILLAELQNVLSKHKAIKNIRGKGLMIGIELNEPHALKYIQEAPNHGIVVNGAAKGSVLRIMPPIIISKQDVDYIVEKLEALFSSIL